MAVQLRLLPFCYIRRPAFPALDSPIATGLSLGPSVAKALGLPVENLAGFTLSFQPSEAVRCTALYYVTAEAGDCFTKIIKEYELIETKSPQ
jgi:hypothetical protein